MNTLGYTITSLAYTVVILFGLALHALTVYYAYVLGGMVPMILTIIFPVAAQMFWAGYIWIVYGAFLNYVTIGLTAYLLIVLACICVNLACSSLTKDQEPDQPRRI